MGSYSLSWAAISPEILLSWFSEKGLEVQVCTTMSSSSASYSDTKLNSTGLGLVRRLIWMASLNLSKSTWRRMLEFIIIKENVIVAFSRNLSLCCNSSSYLTNGSI